MSLVVFTGLVGLVIAPGHLHPVLAGVAVLCIAVGAGAAGAINMWYDRDIDAVMRRTAPRPLPAGRMLPGEALGFGVVLAVGSVLVMGLAINWVAAAIAGADHRLLRLRLHDLAEAPHAAEHRDRRRGRRVPAADRLGRGRPAASAGAAIALFAIIFFWTPPHFWALSLYRADDYAKAGVPMLPVVAGPRETKRQMLLYTLVLWPVSAAPWLLGIAGAVYGISALGLSALFTASSIRVLARCGRAQRPADVRLLAALSVADLQLAAGRSQQRRLARGGVGDDLRRGRRAGARTDDPGAQPGSPRRAGGAGGAVLRHHHRADRQLAHEEAAGRRQRGALAEPAPANATFSVN